MPHRGAELHRRRGRRGGVGGRDDKGGQTGARGDRGKQLKALRPAHADPTSPADPAGAGALASPSRIAMAPRVLAADTVRVATAWGASVACQNGVVAVQVAPHLRPIGMCHTRPWRLPLWSATPYASRSLIPWRRFLWPVTEDNPARWAAAGEPHLRRDVSRRSRPLRRKGGRQDDGTAVVRGGRGGSANHADRRAHARSPPRDDDGRGLCAAAIGPDYETIVEILRVPRCRCRGRDGTELVGRPGTSLPGGYPLWARRIALARRSDTRLGFRAAARLLGRWVSRPRWCWWSRLHWADRSTEPARVPGQNLRREESVGSPTASRTGQHPPGPTWLSWTRQPGGANRAARWTGQRGRSWSESGGGAAVDLVDGVFAGPRATRFHRGAMAVVAAARMSAGDPA